MEGAYLSHLLKRAGNGDAEAVRQIVQMLDPVLRRHSRTVGDDDAYSELVEWLLRAIGKYTGRRSDQSRHPDPHQLPYM